MNTTTRNVFFALLAFFSAAVLSHAQTVGCDSMSNVIIYSNYDGGILNINVDQNIPNLKIGVVSYEAVQINISGTYAANVTKVWYAGYNGANDNCNLGVTNTTISGVAPGVDTIQIYPAVTYPDANGSPNMVCSYQCVSGNSGGCNTPEQVVHFFLTKFGETNFRFHRTLYNCWPPSVPVSGGGNCCLAPLSLSVQNTVATNGLSVFPNPAATDLGINVQMTNSENARIVLYDALGNAVRSSNEMLVTGENNLTWDVSNYATGIYLLQVNTASGVLSEKITIQ
jgi:hypothetical protein